MFWNIIYVHFLGSQIRYVHRFKKDDWVFMILLFYYYIIFYDKWQVKVPRKNNYFFIWFLDGHNVLSHNTMIWYIYIIA
jgi:hypothetical protein